MKISFDFDETLSEPHVQKFAKELVDKGYDVWVVTARCNDNWNDDPQWIPETSGNRDLYYIAEKVGIPHSKCLFTDGHLKDRKLVEHGFNYHFDNLIEEVEAAKKAGIISVLFGYGPEFEEFMTWKDKF